MEPIRGIKPMIYWYLQYNNVAIRAMRVGIDNLIQSVKSDGFGESWHPHRQMSWVFLVSALCFRHHMDLWTIE